LDPNVLQSEYHFSRDYDEKQKKQLKKFNKYFAANGFGIEMIETPKLRNLVYNGIPDQLRGKLWQYFSWSLHLETISLGEYEYLNSKI